jgi:hypothetical protein
VGVVVECKRGITFRRVCLFHMSTMLLSNISEGGKIHFRAMFSFAEHECYIQYFNIDIQCLNREVKLR